MDWTCLVRQPVAAGLLLLRPSWECEAGSVLVWVAATPSLPGAACQRTVATVRGRSHTPDQHTPWCLLILVPLSQQLASGLRLCDRWVPGETAPLH